MGRLRKSRWSSLKPDLVCSKNESAKSKVRGFLDDLPPIEEVFPFFNFHSELDHFTTHGSLRPSELDISTFLAQDSLEILEDLFSFPTYSQGDWIWLGEDGYDHDSPPLEPIFSASPSNPIDIDQFTVHEPSYFNIYACPDEEIAKRDYFKKKVSFAATPSNPIDFDQFTAHEPFYFSSDDALVEREVEKRDYYKKKVRFPDSKHTMRKTKPDKHSIYETPRKKANIFRESVLEMSSLVSTQSNPSKHPSKVRENFAPKCDRSIGSTQSNTSKHPSKVRENFAPKCDRSIGSETTMPLKEPSRKSASIEVRFNNVADILTIASRMSNWEFESTANDNDKVTSRSSSRSGKVGSNREFESTASSNGEVTSRSSIRSGEVRSKMVSNREFESAVNSNGEVTSRSSSRSGQVEQVFPIQKVKHNRESLSTPIASCDIKQEDGMMENPDITPYKNLNIDSDSSGNDNVTSRSSSRSGKVRSNRDFESTANGNDKVTSRSSSRSGQVEQVFPMQEVKHLHEGLSTYTDSPIASCDIKQRDGMMENPVITPYKNVNIIDSDETEIYFSDSHPGSSKDDSDETEIYFSGSHPGSSKDDSGGKLSKGEPGVVEMEEPPRRSTRIHLRQCRGKQNNLIEPLWTEDEWWII